MKNLPTLTAMTLAALVLTPALWAASMTVDADRLEVERASDKAIFTGHVVVKRPDMTLTCARLEGDYAKGKPTTMVATGGVTITRMADGDTETATGRQATYTPGSGLLVMTGDVTLTHGGHTLTGERLEYDVKAGKAKLTSPNRVRATLADDEGK